MHPHISQELASEHVADMVRTAERRRQARGSEHAGGSFVRRVYSRYLGRASEGNFEPVRGTGPRARGTGAVM
jgi:hypothetical protein